jgi:uncharacterized membrane protein YphA (DoxX/SURF4 family)
MRRKQAEMESMERLQRILGLSSKCRNLNAGCDFRYGPWSVSSLIASSPVNLTIPLGLIVGFLSRFSALSIIIIMLGAIGMVHAKVGFFMNWTGTQAGEGFEYHLLAIAILLTIVIAGPGRFAIG